MLEAPRGLSHPQTSFIGTVCQGIHHTPFRAAHAPKNPNDSFKRQTTNHHTVKNDHKTIDLETRLQKRAWRNRDKASRTTILHCSRPLSSSQTTTRPDRTRPAARKADGVPPGASGKPHATKSRVAVREPKSIPTPLPAGPQGNPRSQRRINGSLNQKKAKTTNIQTFISGATLKQTVRNQTTGVRLSAVLLGPTSRKESNTICIFSPKNSPT